MCRVYSRIWENGLMGWIWWKWYHQSHGQWRRRSGSLLKTHRPNHSDVCWAKYRNRWVRWKIWWPKHINPTWKCPRKEWIFNWPHIWCMWIRINVDTNKCLLCLKSTIWVLRHLRRYHEWEWYLSNWNSSIFRNWERNLSHMCWVLYNWQPMDTLRFLRLSNATLGSFKCNVGIFSTSIAEYELLQVQVSSVYAMIESMLGRILREQNCWTICSSKRKSEGNRFYSKTDSYYTNASLE